MARGVINTYLADLYKHYMYKHLLNPKEQMDDHIYAKHIKKIRYIHPRDNKFSRKQCKFLK